jgi:pantoate--beta-alanine ligase
MMYPDGYKTWVEVDELSSILCGASRPGHFRGVCTVVLKLIGIVRPHRMFMAKRTSSSSVSCARWPKI